MFCQNCGQAEQEANSFCRQCGEYLIDASSSRKRGFRFKTPDENIRTSLILNLLSSALSFLMAVLLYATHLGNPDTHPVVFLAAALFIVIGIWQLINLIVGLRIKKHFDKRKGSAVDETDEPPLREFVPASGPAQLLNEADLSEIVPASVTEQTTRNLVGKIPNKSSKE